jgi:hypothetical protein
MHLLSFVAAGLFFLSMMLLAAGVALDHGSRLRRASLVSSATSVVLALVIFGALVVAQRPLCEALGGSWVSETQGCRDEWGGNGRNDSSEGIEF